MSNVIAWRLNDDSFIAEGEDFPRAVEDFPRAFQASVLFQECSNCSIKFQASGTIENPTKTRVYKHIYIYSSIVLLNYYIYSQFFYIFVLHFRLVLSYICVFSLAFSKKSQNNRTLEQYPSNTMIIKENQKFQALFDSGTIPNFWNNTPIFGHF